MPATPGPLDVLFNIVPQNPFRAFAAMGTGTTADGLSAMVPSNYTILQVIILRWPGQVRAGADRRQGHSAACALVAEANALMIQVTRWCWSSPRFHLRPDRRAGGGYGFEKLPLGQFVVAFVRRLRPAISRSSTAACCWRTGSTRQFFRGLVGDAGGVRGPSIFAALPLSRAAIHNHGVDKDHAAFAVPLGASIKMDGCGAIRRQAVFIAQYTGIEPQRPQYLHRGWSGARSFRHRGRARHCG